MKAQYLNSTALVTASISVDANSTTAQATKEERVNSVSAAVRAIYLNEVQGFGQVVSIQQSTGSEVYLHYTLANFLTSVVAAWKPKGSAIGLEGSVIAGTVDSNIAALRVVMNCGDLPASSRIKSVVMSQAELSSGELFEHELKTCGSELLEVIKAQLEKQQAMLLEHGLIAGTAPDFYTLSVQATKQLDLVKSLSKLDREKYDSTITAVTDRLECDFFKLDGGKLLFIFDDSMMLSDINSQIAEKFDDIGTHEVVQGDTLTLYKELDKAEKLASKNKDRKTARELSEQLEKLETCLVLVVG